MQFRVAASATASHHHWVAAIVWSNLSRREGPGVAGAYAGIARSHVVALGSGAMKIHGLVTGAEARAYWLEGDLERALGALEDLLAAEDTPLGRTRAYTDIAELLAATEDFEGAIAYADDALAASANAAEPLPMLGLTTSTSQAAWMLMAGQDAEALAASRLIAATADKSELGRGAVGLAQTNLAVVELVAGDPAAARTAAENARRAYTSTPSASPSLGTYANAVGLAARIAAAERVLPNVAMAIELDMDRFPRDDALSLLERLNCRLVVALATYPTGHARASRIHAVLRAAEELPTWELADARRDPLFSWLWAELVRESPELLESTRTVLYRDIVGLPE